MMEVLRYTAFSVAPGGGNPAGVVLDATGFDEHAMQRIAKDVDYSETAFVQSLPDGTLKVRYFSPECEVPFCGHATIATAVAHAERNGAGQMLLATQAGPVSVMTERAVDGSVTATLVSVPPQVATVTGHDLDELLSALRWEASDLDPTLPPRTAYAGAWHPIIAAATRDRLSDLDYDMPSLSRLMNRLGWATVNLIWREAPTVFHSRNPFPPGGVVEDPATGAAAAALGGYLRKLRLIDPPETLKVYQGEDMGRPSLINVHVPGEPGSGISVTGSASQVESDGASPVRPA